MKLEKAPPRQGSVSAFAETFFDFYFFQYSSWNSVYIFSCLRGKLVDLCYCFLVCVTGSNGINKKPLLALNCI